MSAGYTPAGRAHHGAPVILHGRRLLLARASLAVVAVLAVGLFIWAVPLLYRDAQVVCTGCQGHLTPDTVRQHQAFGMSIGGYAAYVVARDVVFAAVYCAVAAVLVWRKSGERMALFSALTLVTFGVSFTGALDVLARVYPGWWWVVTTLGFLGHTSIVLLFYLFPDGRVVPRWSLWLTVPWILSQGAAYFFPDAPVSYQHWPPLLVWLLFFVGVGPAIGARRHHAARTRRAVAAGAGA